MADNRAGSRGVRRRTGGAGRGDGRGGKGGPSRLPLLLLLLLIAASVVAFFLWRNADDDEDEPGLDTGNDQGAQQVPPTAQGGLTAGGRPLLDEAAAGRLGALRGEPVEGRGVAVQSVAADEGFWAGTSESQRVFVFLTPQARTKPGESPLQVRAGQRVDFTGTVKVVPPGPNALRASTRTRAPPAAQPGPLRRGRRS